LFQRSALLEQHNKTISVIMNYQSMHAINIIIPRSSIEHTYFIAIGAP
jgi:hypothetical protein